MVDKTDDTESKSASTVVFACKHPPGLILKIYKSDKYTIPVMGGGMMESSRSAAVGDPVRIHGPAVPFGRTPACEIIGGYALTPDVPANFAREWMKQNAESDLVKNKIVSCHPTIERAKSWSKEMKGIKSGLQPLDPTFRKRPDGTEVPNDNRWPIKTNPNISVLQSDTREN